MTAHRKPDLLYDTDYLQWLETTVEQLRQQKYGAVDWQNLIEELADMGRSERKSVKSNLIVLLLHLLKWQYQPELRSGSWRGSIVEHRQRLQDDLQDSPSLKPYLTAVFDECYLKAVERAIAETGLPPAAFPSVCSYNPAEVLESSFLPE